MFVVKAELAVQNDRDWHNFPIFFYFEALVSWLFFLFYKNTKYQNWRIILLLRTKNYFVSGQLVLLAILFAEIGNGTFSAPLILNFNHLPGIQFNWVEIDEL